MEKRDRTAIYVLAVSVLAAAAIVTIGGFRANLVRPEEASATIGKSYRGEWGPGGVKEMAGEIRLHTSWIFELRRRGYSVDVTLAPEQDGVDGWDVQAIDPRGGMHQVRGATPETALGDLVADITGGLREAHLTSPLRVREPVRVTYTDPAREIPRDVLQANLEWLLVLREQGYQIDVRPQLGDRRPHDQQPGNFRYGGPEVTFTATAALEGGPQFTAEGATSQQALGNLLLSLIASLE